GGLSATDAQNHRMHKRLLQCSSYLWMCQDVRSGLGEVAGRFMQVRQPCKESRRRSDPMRKRRSGQFATDDRLSGGDKILQCQGYGTPSTGRRGPMVACRPVPDDDDLVWRQLQTAEVHCC